MNAVRVTFAALLILSGPALLAAEPLQAVLVVPHPRILPGVPFDFWIELHNPTDTVRNVSVCDPFQVRLVAGDPFHWTETPNRNPHGSYYWGHHGGTAVLYPGDTKILAFPASMMSLATGFFAEPVFSAPGRRLAISLPLCEQTVPPSGPRGGDAKVMTTEAEIEIVTPAGSDAEVWNLLNQASKERWTADDLSSPDRRELLHSVIRDYPDSNYVPYAVLMTGIYVLKDRRECLALQLRTIRRFPDSPAVEGLHFEAWGMARSLELHGVMLAEGAILRRSKHPTTRLLAFGNEER